MTLNYVLLFINGKCFSVFTKSCSVACLDVFYILVLFSFLFCTLFSILWGFCFKYGVIEFLQLSEIRKTNNNLTVIGKTTVDNDKEDYDNDGDDDDGDNGDESDGEEFEQ